MTRNKKTTFRKLLLLSIISMGLTYTATAQSRIYVNEYMNIGVGARGLGMSGAQTASANDVYASFWNPAGLLNIKEDYQVGLMHAQYFSGISKYDYASIAIPSMSRRYALAFSFIRFGTDDIPYTLDYVRPDGSFDESLLKGFSAGDYAGIISFAHKLNVFKKKEIQTRFGVNGKFLYRNVGKMANAWGVGIDAGVQVAYKRLNVGLMIKDLTNTYTNWSFNLTDKEKTIFEQTGNEIPIKSYELMRPRFNLGVSYDILPEKNAVQLLVELGMDITTDGKRNTIFNTASDVISMDPKAGLEIGYKNMIFLRAGVGNFYNVFDNSDTTHEKKYLIYQPSIGAGFKFKSLNIDYSFTNLRVQGAPLMSHIVSLRLDLLKGKTAFLRNKNKYQDDPNAPEIEKVKIELDPKTK